MLERTDLVLANSFSGPPTINVNVPALAAITPLQKINKNEGRKKIRWNLDLIPPETGASMKTEPLLSASADTAFATLGSMVLLSMISVPDLTVLK